ncbi:hypothetical protein EG329_013717 [Mollisiaceae sp. DMI_Dod_QoI]|nr:hypothetical protein EG329_013717 [Helotiales sp. DMI_Dod_QoI]
MAKSKIYIHCVRHAQGFHNLSEANHDLPDPTLTPLGESQCRELSLDFPHASKITHLVASPLRRTIYTTLFTFPSLICESHKVIALPELQETSDMPCDTGSDLSALVSEFSVGKYAGAVDLSLLDKSWNNKKGKFLPIASAIEDRALDARKILRELGEQFLRERAKQGKEGDEEVHMVVTTHGGFLHYFTEDWEGTERFMGTGWANCEWRSYEFVEGKEERASIRETGESRMRRLGTEIPISEEEQQRLKDAAHREWGKRLQNDEAEAEVEGENAKL